MNVPGVKKIRNCNKCKKEYEYVRHNSSFCTKCTKKKDYDAMYGDPAERARIAEIRKQLRRVK